MATTPVSVRLDEPLKARVRSLADQRRRPVHWLMREAIEQYVTREEQREAFRQEALDALGAVPEHWPACDRRRGGCLACRTRGR